MSVVVVAAVARLAVSGRTAPQLLLCVPRDCRASGVRWFGHTLLMADWLIRTSRGWVEPSPPTCGCGSDRHLIGWQACRCGDGPVAGGHRTWECQECGERLAVGCAGRVGMGPMEEYGVRTGGGAKR